MVALEKLTQRYPDLQPVAQDIRKAFELLCESYRQGGKLLVCGNGGSAADSDHITGELMKGFLLQRPLPEAERRKLAAASKEDGLYLAEHLQGALPAISLASQAALMTAIANDVAADMIFAQQVWGYGRPGDVLLGISTSGKARSVLLALQAARARGLRTLGLTGGEGGAMLSLCDVALRAPGSQTPVIQERHLAIYHTLCAMLEAEFFAA
jgi:D-sedoheptulose 7-phosphate isomerase